MTKTEVRRQLRYLLGLPPIEDWEYMTRAEADRKIDQSAVRVERARVNGAGDDYGREFLRHLILQNHVEARVIEEAQG